MTRRPASEEIEAMLRTAVADPDRASLLLQVFYLAQEPDYQRLLGRILTLTPEQCREVGDWLAARFPSAGADPPSGPKIH